MALADGSRKFQRWRVDRGAENASPDRIRCSTCNFAGVDIETVPGESLRGSTQYVTTGTTYVWTSPADALSTIDKAVEPKANSSVSCPFCGGEAFLWGAKGTGHRIP